MVRARGEGTNKKPGGDGGRGTAMDNCWLGGRDCGRKQRAQSRLNIKVGSFLAPASVAATLEASKERRDKVQLTSSGLQLPWELGVGIAVDPELTKLLDADPGWCTPGAGTRSALFGAGDEGGRVQRLPVQSPLPSPSPRPPRMFSDCPSQYMKAVSSSLWPRSRKARTVAALALASMRRPISMVPSTVAGRRGAPEAARGGGGRDMARGRATEVPERCAERTAARPTARDAARSMETAPAHSKLLAPPTAGGRSVAEVR